MSSKPSWISRQQRFGISFLLTVGIAATIYQRTSSHVSIPTGATSSVVSSTGNVTRTYHYGSGMDESRRKTNLEVLEWLLDSTVNRSRDEIRPQIPFIFPRPKRPETVKIYNIAAWQDLQRKLAAVSATLNETFLVVSSGGSASAGASAAGERFYVDFIEYMEMTGGISSKSHFQFLDRAHGSRGSIHSALMRHHFFPPNVDLVFWEFAINDMIFKDHFTKSPIRDAKAARRSLEMWLDAMEQNTPRPPHVILVYLWDSPFKVKMNKTVSQLVFDAHQSFAARYPFVVGHVNLAEYVEELEWGHGWCKQLLVRDYHHPTWLGHAMMGYLLMDLMTTDPDRLRLTMNQTQELERNVTVLKTDFGCHPRYNAFQEVIDESKVSIADWTAEVPRNRKIFPGMLVMEHASFNVTLGKQDPTRIDRQLAVGLPCCHLSRMVTLKLPQFESETAMMNTTLTIPVRAIYATLLRSEGERSVGANFSDVAVFLDGEDVAGYQITLMGTGNWNCWTRNPIGGYWLVLPQQRQVQTIGICSHLKDSCGKPKALGALLIQSLSVWQ